MREPAPRAPFDQGLFLAHFNKGKEHYDQQQFAEAESQLEEAYLLRPRDAKVLNLLGLTYFRQEKLEKAEEVYRKLILESPDAPTLHYNLGLIYFKLERWEEAESSFTKALEISGENPKINFYLGSIYERLHRFQDAIYQYRQAGANIMVRRVEDRMAAGAPRRATTPAAPPAVPPPAAAVGAKPKGDDTAEFKAGEVRDAIEKRAAEIGLAQRQVQSVSKDLLAEGAPGKGGSSDTARFKVQRGGDAAAALAGHAPLPAHTLPPDTGTIPGSFPAPRFGDTPPSTSTLPPAETPPDLTTLPPARARGFHLLRANLLEVEFSGKLFIKQGTIYTYGGNLTFWVKEARPGGRPPLVIVTGTGKLMLTDRDRQITFLQVHEETIFVEPGHLLACEEGLTPRFVTIGEKGGAEMLALDGSGVVALSVTSKPLALAVTPDMPVSVPAPSVISWSGGVTATVVDDRQVYQVMMPSAAQGPVLRLEGTGRLIVEQSA